jgi:RNA polymerase sigma-70 factor (ECF subfamily)
MAGTPLSMSINPTYHHTDEQLRQELAMIDAARENPERFAPLYDKYYKAIFNYVYQRMESRERAFDVTADVFLKALTNLPKYEYRGVPFASWLYRIAHNEMMQFFRKEKDQRTVNADVSDIRALCDESETVFFEEYIPFIKKLILGLKPGELQLVEMRYFEKRPFKEIAEILELTETNAKVRMHRILDKLKKELKNLKT